MACSQSERTLCLIKFYDIPASTNKEALAAQLVAMCGGDNMQMLRTGFSEIKVMALVCDPKTDKDHTQRSYNCCPIFHSE